MGTVHGQQQVCWETMEVGATGGEERSNKTTGEERSNTATEGGGMSNEATGEERSNEAMGETNQRQDIASSQGSPYFRIQGFFINLKNHLQYSIKF